MRVNQLKLLLNQKLILGKIKAITALIFLLPCLSYAGITDDLKDAASSTYNTLGGYSNALTGYANSAYKQVSSFSVSDSIKDVTGKVGGAMDYFSTAGSQYLSKISVSSMADAVKSNNTYQSLVSSLNISSPSNYKSPSITEQLSNLWSNFNQNTMAPVYEYLNKNVLSPLSGAYSSVLNKVFPVAGAAANTPLGNTSIVNVTSLNSPPKGKATFIGDNTYGEGFVKRKTDKNNSNHIVIAEHKRPMPGRLFRPWANMQNIFPMNLRPRPGRGLASMDKMEKRIEARENEMQEIESAFDLFDKEVGGYLVDNSTISSAAVNTNDSAVVKNSNPSAISFSQSGPACKDCHGGNVPSGITFVPKEVSTEQPKTYSLSMLKVETQTQVVNTTAINKASLNDAMGPYRNDGKRVNDQSVYSPKYDVSKNVGDKVSTTLQMYQPTAYDQQVRRSAVLQDKNGTVYYQQFNGTSMQTVSLNKPYSEYTKETLANTQNNATTSVQLFNGQTHDVSKVVFTGKGDNYDERKSGVVTTNNTFIPAYMIDKGKTASGEYTFALPRNIASSTTVSQQVTLQKEMTAAVNTQSKSVVTTSGAANQQAEVIVNNPALNVSTATTVTQGITVKPASSVQRYQLTAQDQQVQRSAVLQDKNGTAYYQQFNGTSAQTVSLNKPYNDYANETLANTTNNATTSVQLFNGQTYDVSRVVFAPKTAFGFDDYKSGVVTTNNTFIPACLIDKGKTASGEYTFALPRNIATFQKDNNNNL